MPQLSQICRTREIPGYAFPGIIHNGQYFMTDLKVFADGLIHCWDMVDVPLFEAKLRSGWVVTSLPKGESLSIHEIGVLELASAKWTHTPGSLVDFILARIRELNPRLENLFDCHGRETEEIDGVRYAAVGSGSPRPWKTDGPITPLMHGIYGRSLKHFLAVEGVLHLVTLELFPDDSVVVSGGPEPRTLSFQELQEQLTDAEVFRLPAPGDRVSIGGLVSFDLAAWIWCVEPQDLLAEICDLHEQVLGRPGAVESCRRALDAYLEEQTSETLENLRRSYEAVPEHLRLYCGDMDSKDIPIRMILYGGQEIEDWSHYQVSERLGFRLPTIRIPDPPEGD